MHLTLLGTGLFFALLFTVNNLLQLARGQNRLKFWGTAWAYLTAVLLLLSISLNQIQLPPADWLRGIVLAGGGALAVIGLLLLVIEWIRPNRNLSQSRGLLSLGTGTLVIFGSLLAPLLIAYFSVPFDAPTPGSTPPAFSAETSAWHSLISSASTHTGQSYATVIDALQTDSLSDFLNAQGNTTDNILAAALSMRQEQIKTQMINGTLPRLEGAQLLLAVPDTLRDKFNDTLPADQQATLAPLLLATATPTLTPTATFTPTITHTPTAAPTQPPTLTATPTTDLFATSTPTPTATLGSPCLASVPYNLNLRTTPDSAQSEIITVIPFDSVLPLYASNADKTWWYAQYETYEGWVDGAFINMTANCDTLPVR